MTEQNIFAELGLENAQELKLKSKLAGTILKKKEKCQLYDHELADMCNLPDEIINSITEGKWDDVDLDCLDNIYTVLLKEEFAQDAIAIVYEHYNKEKWFNTDVVKSSDVLDTLMKIQEEIGEL
jgi:predicted XRE-type DNA-binding protein